MTDATLLDLAASLALTAGAAILAIRARGFETLRKADRSVVTEADHAAERIILSGLRSAGIPVVAEEEAAAGLSPAACGEYWLVDPLDGTRYFADARDDFCVNIGLVRDGRPVLGVVLLPASGELFGGTVGTGAWKGAARTPIRARVIPPGGMRVLASDGGEADPRLLAMLQGREIYSVEGVGAAVKFCRVAEGAADFYARVKPTMEWDTAAPQAIVEAAGGHVLALPERVPLGYGKPGWLNPHFLCTGVV